MTVSPLIQRIVMCHLRYHQLIDLSSALTVSCSSCHRHWPHSSTTLTITFFYKWTLTWHLAFTYSFFNACLLFIFLFESKGNSEPKKHRHPHPFVLSEWPQQPV